MRTRADFSQELLPLDMKHMDFAKHTFKIAPSWRNLNFEKCHSFFLTVCLQGQWWQTGGSAELKPALILKFF